MVVRVQMGGGSGRSVWASDAYVLTFFGYKCSVKPPFCIGKLLTLFSGAMGSMHGHYSLPHIFFFMPYPHMTQNLSRS